MKNTQPEQLTNLGYCWWLAACNAPGVTSQVPLETVLSYPVAAADELRFFHYQVRDGQIVRPFTLIRAKLPKIIVIEVLLNKHRELYPGLPNELGTFNIQWDFQLEKQMLNLLPSLMEKFPQKPAGTIGQHYLEAFEILTPKSLMPFYMSLNPAFFDWLAGK
jgi:hypothetical protein